MHILLTGGGTGGHVVPNIALIDDLRKADKKIRLSYIGQKNSIEEKLIQSTDGVDFYTIPAGKLRRYFSIQNFIDLFKVCAGTLKSIYLMRAIKPDVIFCKGGFVSFPVGFAGWLLRKPVIIHESDVSPGLATKLLSRIATDICISFTETQKFFKKSHITGNPVRKSILSGSKEKAFKFLKWQKNDRQTILIMGGSSGAERVNQLCISIMPELLKKYRVIHITGKGKAHYSKKDENYRHYEYINEALSDIYALSDIIISRAGANTIAEFIVLEKAVILIPLSLQASRGDQIENTEQLTQINAAAMIDENTIKPEKFLKTIEGLDTNKLKKNIHTLNKKQKNANQLIIDILKKWAKK